MALLSCGWLALQICRFASCYNMVQLDSNMKTKLQLLLEVLDLCNLVSMVTYFCCWLDIIVLPRLMLPFVCIILRK